MTPADLDRLEALAAAATAGPWEADRTRVKTCDAAWIVVSANAERDDASFIAAAREAVPALVAEVRATRGMLRDAMGAANEIRLMSDKWRNKAEECVQLLARSVALAEKHEADATALRAEVRYLRREAR